MNDHPHRRLLKTLQKERSEKMDEANAAGKEPAGEWLIAHGVDSDALRDWIFEMVEGTMLARLLSMADTEDLARIIKVNAGADTMVGFMAGYEFALNQPDGPAIAPTAVVREARALRSNGENHSYDRGLVELVADCLGISKTEAYTKVIES